MNKNITLRTLPHPSLPPTAGSVGLTGYSKINKLANLFKVKNFLLKSYLLPCICVISAGLIGAANQLTST
jgi:hypothetical protein